MFFSSGSFGESPFSRTQGNSSTRSSSISKETSSLCSQLNEGVENKWNNNGNHLLVTPSRNSLSTTSNNRVLSSNSRGDNQNKIQRVCLPVTISMIKRSLELNQNAFVIFGMRASSVTFVGWISHRELLASRMLFRVSDGTGGMDARYDIDSELMGNHITAYLEDLREGTLIRVVGQVVPGKGGISSYLSCYTVLKLKDCAEYAYYHPIEVSYVLGQLSDLGEADSGCVWNGDNDNDKAPALDPKLEETERSDFPTPDDRSGVDLQLLKSISVPDDITDSIQKNVYRALSYELDNLKDERSKSYGISKKTIVSLLRSHYEPSVVLSALSELESKYAVIYEAMDDHYCVL